MRARQWGRIIIVIGTAARNPATTFMAGGIANAGLINSTRALGRPRCPRSHHRDSGESRSNSKRRPQSGRCRSPHHGIPARSDGTPRDVADLVTFLASDRASFINGETITWMVARAAGLPSLLPRCWRFSQSFHHVRFRAMNTAGLAPAAASLIAFGDLCRCSQGSMPPCAPTMQCSWTMHGSLKAPRVSCMYCRALRPSPCPRLEH
jgi:hypothetical protein